jgi:hypothetical protein
MTTTASMPDQGSMTTPHHDPSRQSATVFIGRIPIVRPPGGLRAVAESRQLLLVGSIQRGDCYGARQMPVTASHVAVASQPISPQSTPSVRHAGQQNPAGCKRPAATE